MKNETRQLIKHLSKKWGERPCPMCGENKWSISEKVFELKEYEETPLFGMEEFTHDPVFPVIPVSCKNCGNTHFISAVISGIISKNYNNE